MTQTKLILPLIAAAAALAGCMPAPAPVPAYDQPAVAPAPVQPVPAAASGISGLEERKPDLCGAKNYTSALNQPGSVIPTLGVTKEYRVVEYRGIEPQEYDPNRVVFRLDAAGNVTNVDCG
ncbi:hypothetical protein [Paracoccus fistulariae]|uniref:Peptidase inhibitor I78 family protein n=1 Tax=Paracoccus fistulariae TaxID=658446 RepID=A0ABY7SJ39_9RHOB|nr:hypothetical protein [Paracoccus fistulariae]MDB6182185.1 hypothetical protein [Paracoccus fistulariae]WCR06593.1 hypothetical protein JHX87_14060 [Paracoccus fistulariae]